MGGVRLLACQDFLLREACVVFWCMEMDFFSLECNDAFLGDLARPQLHVTGKGRCEGPVVLKACLMFVFPGTGRPL